MNLKVTLLSAAVLAGCSSDRELVINELLEQSSSAISNDAETSSTVSDIADIMAGGLNRFEPGVDVECIDLEEEGDAFIQTQIIVSPSRAQVYTKVSGQADSANSEESYMVVDNGRMVNWCNANSEVTEIVLPEKQLNQQVLPFAELTIEGLAFPGYFDCKEWDYDASVFAHPTPTDTVDLSEFGDDGGAYSVE